jgi:hypothetical protein
MARAVQRLGVALTVVAIAVSSATAQPHETIYEIYVSGAGKSSGLRGVLHDGRQLALEGGDIQTPIGTFSWVPCLAYARWRPCGRWRADTNPLRHMRGLQNPSLLCYRITRTERGGVMDWRGELGEMAPGLDRDLPWRSNVCVRPIAPTQLSPQPMETPMGVFRWTSGRLGTAEWRGWVPEGWPDLPLTETGQRTGN